jgi:hypothetical protein
LGTTSPTQLKATQWWIVAGPRPEAAALKTTFQEDLSCLPVGRAVACSQRMGHDPVPLQLTCCSCHLSNGPTKPPGPPQATFQGSQRVAAADTDRPWRALQRMRLSASRGIAVDGLSAPTGGLPRHPMKAAWQARHAVELRVAADMSNDVLLLLSKPGQGRSSAFGSTTM